MKYTCPCGARNGLFHECLVCNAVGSHVVRLGLAIARFVRVCEIEALAEEIEAALWDAYYDTTNRTQVDRADAAVWRLAALALEGGQS